MSQRSQSTSLEEPNLNSLSPLLQQTLQQKNYESPNDPKEKKRLRDSPDALDSAKIQKVSQSQIPRRIINASRTDKSNGQTPPVMKAPVKFSPKPPVNLDANITDQTILQKSQASPSKQKTFKQNRLPADAFNNRYPSSSESGQYDVIFDSDYSQEGIKPPNQLTVCRVVAKIQENLEVPNDAFQSKKVGQKILISFTSPQVANAMLTHQLLRDHKLIAYIPQFKTMRQGIIKGVPLDYSPEEIIEDITSPVAIKSATRLNRFFRIENQPHHKPTQSILLTFEGQDLPKVVTLWHTRLEVHPFISPVKRCNKCLRFGHTGRECQSDPICDHCAKHTHGAGSQCPDADKPPSCINCKKSHNSRDDKCPALLHQKRIHHLASIEGISYLEAKMLLREKTNPPKERAAPKSPPPEFNTNTFPTINNNNFLPQPATHPRPTDSRHPHTSTALPRQAMTPSSEHSTHKLNPRPHRAQPVQQVGHPAQAPSSSKFPPNFYPFAPPHVPPTPQFKFGVKEPVNAQSRITEDRNKNKKPLLAQQESTFTNLNQYLNIRPRATPAPPPPPPQNPPEPAMRNTLADLQNVLSQLKEFLAIFTEKLSPLMTALSLNDNLKTLVNTMNSITIPNNTNTNNSIPTPTSSISNNNSNSTYSNLDNSDE